MSGRIKQKVYEYDLKGNFLRDYESISEYCRIFYPEDKSKRPIFLYNELGFKYNIFDDTIIFLERPGKKNIQLIISIHNSPFCNTLKGKPVEVLNYKNEVIAEFSNRDLLVKLMPNISQATISRHLTGVNLSEKKNKGKLGLKFRFKQI